MDSNVFIKTVNLGLTSRAAQWPAPPSPRQCNDYQPRRVELTQILDICKLAGSVSANL